MVRFYASDRYKDSYNLAWETTGQLIIWRYYNAQAHTILGRVKNIADFGISGPSDWFNAKLKIDAKVNASDATKQTVYLELYLNDKLAFTYTVEEVNAAATRNKIFVNTSSSISARVPMDVQYEQEKLETKCNADVTALNEKYAVYWKEKADEYAEKLKDYYSENQNDGMIDEINASREDWEDYYEKQTAFYLDYLEFVYCGGSITPIISSAYEMNLCRDRAEELYQMCRSLSIEVRPL